MKYRAELTIVLKGACMGVADVIPGVSGGTLALILGIYQQFIDAVKSISPRPVLPFLRWVFSGFKAEQWQVFMEALGTIHLRFLIPLGAGIAVAMAVGAKVIPELMESYPATMRGLFFGLIVASVSVPIKMMPSREWKHRALAAGLALVCGATGFSLTDPNAVVDTTSQWVHVQVEHEQSLELALRRGPSALTANQVYWSEQNTGLRASHRAADPRQAAAFAVAHHAAGEVRATDKHTMKELTKPYNELLVPAGTVIKVPRPSYWFVFLAGAIAICAMVLPGVSGSFLLLVFGVYYFILNAAKSIPVLLLEGEVPTEALLYVACMVAGIGVGLLSFARVMSFLLQRFPTATMGALAGLMLGCLRAVWPYQQTVDGTISNYVPAAWSAGDLIPLGAVGAGAVLVIILQIVGGRSSGSDVEVVS
jgi:putative membrane protein